MTQNVQTVCLKAPSPARLESSISKSAMEITDKVSHISLAYPQSRRAFIYLFNLCRFDVLNRGKFVLSIQNLRVAIHVT